MYVTQARIETAIPGPHLVDALDDDRDGQLDPEVLGEILASASEAVDAFLCGLFTVPFPDPAPAPVKEAAFIFACERIYDRRQGMDTNPFKARADFWRERLATIGKGEAPLDATITQSFPPGAAITEAPVIDGTMR